MCGVVDHVGQERRVFARGIRGTCRIARAEPDFVEAARCGERDSDERDRKPPHPCILPREEKARDRIEDARLGARRQKQIGVRDRFVAVAADFEELFVFRAHAIEDVARRRERHDAVFFRDDAEERMVHRLDRDRHVHAAQNQIAAGDPLGDFSVDARVRIFDGLDDLAARARDPKSSR